MRAIDADFVQDALTKTITEILSKSQNESTQYVAMGLASIKTIIDIAPTLDVAPVKHGEWILRHVGAGHYWECSVCNKNPCIYVTKDTKFCPNCGAQMDAGQEGDGHG